MQVGQEELRVSNEELEERGRALMDSQARLESQQAELEQTNVNLEEHAQHLERQKVELLRAQSELKANALALEQASQYKSEFLANMSHELRTPLNSSLILAKLLQDNKRGNLTEEQVRYAATIHSSNSDLLSLINDILDLSKVEAGQMDVQFAPVAIDGILQSLKQSFSPIAESRGVMLSTQRAADVPAYFVTDNQRLQQVLRNLLSNAFKFTERGQVSIEVHPAGEGAIRFDVRDTGIGIPRDKQDLIFQAFQQADGTTSRKYGGSGLGLSISREFSRLLGGSVSVSSEPGQGSVFSVTLPLDTPEGTVTAKLDVIGPVSEPEPAAEQAASSVTPPGLAKFTPKPMASFLSAPQPIADDRAKRTRPDRVILAVEDDINFAHILQDLAHELEFDFVHATTATQGVELARELQPNGIVLDVGLPDQSGLTVLEWLKHDPLTRHIPIHIVSATDHADIALHLGAIGYTLKPSARETLAGAIRKLEARSAQGMRRVLVVEDDPALRQSIHALLKSEAVEIVEAGSVAQALEEMERGTFDCVVMDLALPDGSGYELIERVSTEGEHASPPVIVYTGRVLSPDEEQRLRRYSKSIIIKGAKSPERLVDEVTLFLHSVESALPPEQQRMLRAARQRDHVFEGPHDPACRRRRAQHLRVVACDRAARREARDRAQRPRGARCARAQSRHRPRADGHHDAGDGRPDRDGRDQEALRARAPADHRAHRESDGKRSPEVPGGRRRRLYLEAHRRRQAGVAVSRVAAPTVGGRDHAASPGKTGRGSRLRYRVEAAAGSGLSEVPARFPALLDQFAAPAPDARVAGPGLRHAVAVAGTHSPRREAVRAPVPVPDSAGERDVSRPSLFSRDPRAGRADPADLSVHQGLGGGGAAAARNCGRSPFCSPRRRSPSARSFTPPISTPTRCGKPKAVFIRWIGWQASARITWRRVASVRSRTTTTRPMARRSSRRRSSRARYSPITALPPTACSSKRTWCRAATC